MTERVYLVSCLNCGKRQQVAVRTRGIMGKTKKCVFCGKKFKLKTENVLMRVL